MFLFRNTVLPKKREVRASLSKIYGISLYKANLIANRSGLKYPYYNTHLNKYKKSYLIYLLKKLIKIDTKIKRKINNNINRHIAILSYKGLRHNLCLTVRGQRTRTNSATQRKKRKI